MADGRTLVMVQNVFTQGDEPGQLQYFVLLSDETVRRLVIYVGQFEALGIHLALNGEPQPRPMSGDLMLSSLQAFGISVVEVALTDIQQETYIAEIVLELGNDIRRIDARASDAIGLAIRARAPIYVANAIMEKEAQPSPWPPSPQSP